MLKYMVGFGALWFGIHSLVMIIDGLTDHIVEADAAVILGNQVFPDGTMADRLRARVDRGLDLYRDGKVKYLIVSGGIGEEGQDEALVMGAYLMKNGVPDSAIIRDNKGIKTYYTAKNLRKIMPENGLESVIAVTSYYHISRTRLACKKFGVPVVGTAHAAFEWEWRNLYAIPREFIGYYWYLIRNYPKA